MAQPQIQPRFGLLYLLKRSLAFLFDCALNIALCAAAFSVALWRQQIEPEALLAPGVALLSALFLASFNWALITAQEVAFGTTAGKRLFGLSLRGSAAAVFLRAFFFVPSVGLFAFGLIWSLFDRRRRCWHDVAVELQPLEIARL